MKKPALEKELPLPEGSSAALTTGAICHSGTGLVSSHHGFVHAVGLWSLALTIHFLQISAMYKSKCDFNVLLFFILSVFLRFFNINSLESVGVNAFKEAFWFYFSFSVAIERGKRKGSTAFQ